MRRNGKVVLSVTNLSIGYGAASGFCPLVPPINASGRTGELIAVIGRNGIGKSTFLRTITGIQKPLEGEVRITGLPLESYKNKSRALNIGFISTEPVRVENMTVYELVALGRYPHTGWTGKLNPSDREAIEFSISNSGLGKLRGRNINELSDGERQRAMIARVLAQDSAILVMDEPTAFLDIRSRYEIIHLLQDLTRIENKTIIFSTHDFSVAAGECDKIWMFLDDQFVEGAPEDLILDDDIGKLFGNSVVSFNPEEGNFTFNRPFRGAVNLYGSGIEVKWTSKAINRAGFEVTDRASDVKVTVRESGKERIWEARNGAESARFSKIYDLVAWLNKL